MAQMVEQRIRNARVKGSSPFGGSNLKNRNPLGFAVFYFILTKYEFKDIRRKTLLFPLFPSSFAYNTDQ